MRALVAALLVANLAFYAWSQGWLDTLVGVRARGEREPERLARQVHPELIRVLPSLDAASAVAQPASAAPRDDALACLQAGPFTPAELDAALAALPAGAGSRVIDVRSERPPTWIVYMGRFTGVEGVCQKEEELGRIHLGWEELLTDPPELAPGLVLGRFDSRAAAEAGLARLVQRGVRTARVAQLAPATMAHRLRAENADAALKAQLAALADAPFATRRFEPCPPAEASSAAASVR
ncbi:MAG TPA: hypothetical protein VF291_14815 [Burkholderiaceae bacterium]